MHVRVKFFVALPWILCVVTSELRLLCFCPPTRRPWFLWSWIELICRKAQPSAKLAFIHAQRYYISRSALVFSFCVFATSGGGGRRRGTGPVPSHRFWRPHGTYACTQDAWAPKATLVWRTIHQINRKLKNRKNEIYVLVFFLHLVCQDYQNQV